MKKWVFVLSLSVAFQANAACDEEGYFDCGETGDVKWYVSSDKKTFTVSGNGAMGNYEQTKVYEDGVEKYNFTTAPWKDYTFDVENIVIKEGVTAVGDYAFCTFLNTTNVSLPNTLTSIGNRSFRNLENLTNIELPDSLISIGDGAFLSDVSLQNIVIPESVTSIGNGAFYNAKGLQSVIVPASVTSIGNDAFGNSGRYNIAGDVYCEQVEGETSPCAEGVLGLPQNRFKYYTKNDKGTIIFEGQKYSSLERLARQIPIRRIYTINEASKAAGKKNSVMIRYK